MITRNVCLLVSSLAGLAVCPAVSFAQPGGQPQERELREEFGRPLGARREAASTQMMMTQTDGKDTVTVRINDGEVSAEINGKPVPPDRVRRGENTVEILGEDGKVLHTFKMGIVGGRAERFAPRARPGQALQLERRGQNALIERAQPKVMIGITMSDAEPRLLEHLGLKDASGVLVDSVVPGLGAQKAGLQAHDLITEVDGKRNLTQESLREVLASKKPGDEVKIKFVRKGGNEQDAVIKLEAFDSGRLGVAAPEEIMVEGQEIFPGMAQGFFFGEPFDHEQIRTLIDEAMKDLRNQMGDAGEIREKALKHLEEAMKELEDTKIKVRNWAEEGRGQWQEIMPRIRIFDEDGPRALVRPAPPEAPRPPAAGNLDRIADQLERLSQRLDAIEKKLEEKK